MICDCFVNSQKVVNFAVRDEPQVCVNLFPLSVISDCGILLEKAFATLGFHC